MLLLYHRIKVLSYPIPLYSVNKKQINYYFTLYSVALRYRNLCICDRFIFIAIEKINTRPRDLS